MLIVFSGSEHLSVVEISDASDVNENCSFQQGEGYSLVQMLCKKARELLPSGVTAGFRITPALIKLVKNAST